MLVSYFKLFKQEIASFCSLKIIKSAIAKYLVCILAQPELDSKQENFTLTQKAGSFVGCIANHASKLFCSSYFCKNAPCVLIDWQTCKIKNVDVERFSKFLGKFFFYLNTTEVFISMQLLEKAIYIGLKWYVYSNTQIKFLSEFLYSVKEKKLIFSSLCLLVFSNAIKHLSQYLSKFKVNLKSLICIFCKYVKKSVHLFYIDCVTKNSSSYLFRPSKQSIKHLITSIRNKLYHKNKKGRWKNNNSINSLRGMVLAQEVLSIWYDCYSSILSKAEVVKINRVADRIVYKWQTK